MEKYNHWPYDVCFLEDVLSDNIAHYWSPDDVYIMFAQFDDTSVPWMSWPTFGEADDLYGQTTSIKYPKVRENDSAMST